MILLIFILILFVLYTYLIFSYWKSWNTIPEYAPSAPVSCRMTLVIPARNEEGNIRTLLTSIQKQDYDASYFETIVVDDHSTDQTALIAGEFAITRVVQLKEDAMNSYKKKAIEAGIGLASGDLIVTTDADCVAPSKWLRTMAAFKEEKNAVFIAAPVVMNNDQSFLQIFQALDFMVLQGITGAVVSQKKMPMCNGANLAYERKVFYEVNGFADIDHIASGDDMLLMNKIWKKHPGSVHYLKSKDAIVSTQPMLSWKSFFNQRIRWASKATAYEDKTVTAVLLLVYLFNLSFLILLITAFWHTEYWFWLLGLWLAKTTIELPFVYSVARFFDKTKLVRYFPFFQPLHICYTIISGLFGQFGKYEWKGRKVK